MGITYAALRSAFGGVQALASVMLKIEGREGYIPEAVQSI
jgi:hypothetical protein